MQYIQQLIAYNISKPLLYKYSDHFCTSVQETFIGLKNSFTGIQNSFAGIQKLLPESKTASVGEERAGSTGPLISRGTTIAPQQHV